MSDNDAWDAEDFEPKGPTVTVPSTDKWDGEDEDDDVKDDWDADSEEETSKSESKPAPKAPQSLKKKKIKSLKEKIAAREAEAEEEPEEELTAEQKAERKRQQKLREEEETFNLTRDMLGLKTEEEMIPESKEDFEAFGKALCDKLRVFQQSEHFNDMVETIVKDVTLEVNLATLKKLKMHIEGLHSTRLKEEKANKNKKKGAARTTVKYDLDKDLYGGAVEYGDDMDDFM